ncbi:MAG TPA: patatin-like phospholipase family protein [Acidobacteriaceae bacterium]|nr:patatin-like phospholipase family protein [Acidobacteriaceae bacterium]
MTHREWRRRLASTALAGLLAACTGPVASAQTKPSEPAASTGASAAQQTGAAAQKGAQAGIGQKNTGQKANPSGQDKSSSSKPATAGEEAASATKLRLGPLDPSTPPKDLPKNRPVIGLAMGGGAALALSEIGTLQWLEDHRIPVDVIAGTSMGSILAALYSTGTSPEQMEAMLNPQEVSRLFRIQAEYGSRSFRRREDEREIPNGIGIGLKHGVSLRNSLLTDTGLNELLDRVFMRYNDQTDFNTLPIPFRCDATDLNSAKSVTFARGSLQDAVRASASLPGVFRPFEMNGHEYVDGAILENLPTPQVKAMKADVIIGVTLPLSPVGKGDLDSILGVLQRAFAVGIEYNEARDRKLANVVIMPNVEGFTGSDYSKVGQLAARGYAAAEDQRDVLMKYALSQEDWDAYLAKRRSKERPDVGPVLQVKVKAPNHDAEEAVRRRFDPLIGKPVDTDQIENLLADVRSDGRYDADYTVGYSSNDSTRPIILVSVADKKTGPPFLDLGFNIAAQTGGVTRATLQGIILDQDAGGYGSELRAKFDVGFQTLLEGEYFRKAKGSGFFVAPRANLLREPFYIYAPNSNTRLSERQSQFAGVAADVGWGDGRTQEVRAGWEFQNVEWNTSTGNDGLPDYSGNAQKGRIRYVLDTQDRALVPRYGMRLNTSLGYIFDTPGSPSAPQLFAQFNFAHALDKPRKNLLLANVEGGTMFNRDVAQPFRYTLGGPLRLSAEAIDQLRGTDYFLITPGYLRRVATLPTPLGQSIYVGGALELGQMRSPDGPTITREDLYFGIVAETPLGVITVAPAIGSNGQHKLVFTVGRFF